MRAVRRSTEISKSSQNNDECIPLHERRIISSRVHTEMLFDEATTDQIRIILTRNSRQIFGKVPSALLAFPLAQQERLVQRFAKSIVKPLSALPHFLYNRIGFEVQSIGSHQSLFGNGYQHTFWTIIIVIVNDKVSPEVLVDAMNDNFEKEIIRLRSVVRHEFTHRLDMERIHPNPVKRIQSRRFAKAVLPSGDLNDYYEKPVEIIAHANHTVELLMKGHEKGWREVLANYVLTDNSPGHVNTRKYIMSVSKLMKEYKIPFTQRILVRRVLGDLANKMRMRINDISDKEIIDQRNEIVKIGMTPEQEKYFPTVRLQAK